MAEEAPVKTTNKPSVLSLAIKQRASLYTAYMPFIRGGGLFIPTNKPFKVGEEVFLLLSLINDPEKLKVMGHIVWITTRTQVGKPQGVGVQFSEAHGGLEAKTRIENILGQALKSSRSTHTM